MDKLLYPDDLIPSLESWVIENRNKRCWVFKVCKLSPYCAWFWLNEAKMLNLKCSKWANIMSWITLSILLSIHHCILHAMAVVMWDHFPQVYWVTAFCHRAWKSWTLASSVHKIHLNFISSASIKFNLVSSYSLIFWPCFFILSRLNREMKTRMWLTVTAHLFLITQDVTLLCYVSFVFQTPTSNTFIPENLYRSPLWWRSIQRQHSRSWSVVSSHTTLRLKGGGPVVFSPSVLEDS